MNSKNNTDKTLTSYIHFESPEQNQAAKTQRAQYGVIDSDGVENQTYQPDHLVDHPFFDQDLQSISLIDGAIALNVMVHPRTDKEWVYQQLASMEQDLNMHLASVQHDNDAKMLFDALLDYFYQTWKFVGDRDTFFMSENTFVESVLKRRKGIPVSLGGLLLYFSQKLNLPVYGVMFPSQFILKFAPSKQKAIYIDPFDGQMLDNAKLNALLIGYEGPLARLTPKHLAVADTAAILARWLAVSKGAFIREEDFISALRCSDIALKLMPDDPYEIRDRGFIYQQLQCHKMAAEDFQFFIDNCPEDPASSVLKLQVSALNRHSHTLH